MRLLAPPAADLQKGLKALVDGGAPPKVLIIDDGWQQTDVDPEFRAAGNGGRRSSAPEHAVHACALQQLAGAGAGTALLHHTRCLLPSPHLNHPASCLFLACLLGRCNVNLTGTGLLLQATAAASLAGLAWAATKRLLRRWRRQRRSCFLAPITM